MERSKQEKKKQDTQASKNKAQTKIPSICKLSHTKFGEMGMLKKRKIINKRGTKEES